MFSFIYLFLRFKIVFVYFYAYTFVHIYKITCLAIEHTNIYNYMEITITGTRARLFDYTVDISNGP